MPLIDDPKKVVVFMDADGNPFSMDPRWRDKAFRDEWKASQTQAEPDDGVEVTEDDEELPPYSEWKNQALRDELHERGLSLDGTKAEMVKRLEKDDEKAEG